jgi:signal transduction histidine kinase/ligand-binding sensor domain-containing protein/DNA-binding response OmpR family regulator
MEGYVWVGTDYGLNRFNGIQFAHYYNNPNDSASLLHNSVKELMLDRNGTLWIGFVNGLQYYVPEEENFRQIQFEGDVVPHVLRIEQFKSGEIWVATSGYGIFRVDTTKKRAFRVDNIPQIMDFSFYNYVYEDSLGVQWFGINEVGLLQYNPATRRSKIFSREEIPSASSISGMTEDRAGVLWITTTTNVCRFDRQANSFHSIQGDDSWIPARQIVSTNTGQILIATYGKGLKQIENGKYITQHIYNPHISLSRAKIPVLYEDRNRNLWLCCYQKGLLMVSNEVSLFDKWAISPQQYPEAGTVQSVFIDRDGNVWNSVENESVFKMDKQGNIVEHLNLDGHNFSSVFQDRAGNIWFGGRYSGLFQLDPKTGKTTKHLNVDKYKFDFKSIAEDENGNFYLSAFGFGFIYYKPATHEKIHFNNNSNKNSVSNNWIYKIFIDSQGFVWFAHFNGIDCYNPKTGIFTPYMLPNLTKYITYCLLEDTQGNIWAGTNQGLACIDHKADKAEIFQEKDGLSCNIVYAVAKDTHGNIWCATLKGISKLQVEERKFYRYNTGNEMTDNEYTSNAAVAVSPEGRIYFGGTQGITVFDPDQLSASKKTENVALSAIYLNGKTVKKNTLSGNNQIINGKNDICLSFFDNTFTLEFTTFTFDDPSNTFYEYRFRDKEETWNITRPGINQIIYNHLLYGKYRLDVRACRNGVYSDILPLTIHILSPWWQSWWAYLLYIVLATFILSQIYFAVKHRHLHEMNEAKIKLFVNLSHEIRSPMTLIVNPLDTMLKKDYDEKTLRMLRMMKKNADRIIGLMNQLLDMRKIEKGRMTIKCSKVDLIPYIKDIMDLYEYQVNKRNIRLCLDAEAETIPAWIDSQHFDKVLVNIITNALKYTPSGGIIKILLQECTDETFIGDLHHYIEIQILDTGKGIDADKLEKIFERFYTTPAEGEMGGIGFGIGLNLCRLIVKLHHGTITAHNREDTQGSCFTIRIPYGNMHLKKDEIADETTQAKNTERHISTDIDDDEQKPKFKRAQSGTGKILVVDDDEEILAYLFAELSGTYKVRTCNNGNDAWQIILAEKPQLVISDVIMPGMDGYTLLKQIKKNAQVNHIPIILLTSKTESEDRIKGIKSGTDAYLNKPFNLEELKARVANLLENACRLKGKFSGMAEQENRVKKIEIKLKNDELMERIMKVINQNIANPDLDVDFLAREAGISRVHLHRKLKEMTGIPVAAFIRNIRLQQAAQLLKNKQQDVAQVGYAVGYENQANFATIFKKQYGVAPSKYAETFQNQPLNTAEENNVPQVRNK